MASETNMSADQGRPTKTDNPLQHRPPSPVPSVVSMKSDRSKDDGLNFRTNPSPLQYRPPSPVPSDVSMKSDWSKDDGLNFSELQQKRPPSPVTSVVSMKSDQSRDDGLNFRTKSSPLQHRPPSPVPSDVSMKSDRSKDDGLNFSELQQKRPPSPVTSVVSMKSDQSKDDGLNFRTKPSPLQHRPPSPVPSDVSMKSDQSKDDGLNFSELQQHRPPSPVTSVVSMKSDQSKDDGLNFRSQPSVTQQSELPSGQPIKEGKSGEKVQAEAKKKLTAYLKKRIRDQYEEQVHNKETDTELYITQSAKNNQDDQRNKRTKYNQIFKRSHREKKTRTVITTGVAGIGKTLQAGLFMVDWAKGKSNTNIDYLFSLHFKELNSRKDKDQSLEDLLRHFFKEAIQPGIFSYDKCEVTFVLDGLDECQLPLDFDNNDKLTETTEEGSTDALLTNLIQGNLLPSARLWIISQPSAVDKIPPEHIDRVTECRESVARRQKLSINLKKRFIKEISQTENKNPPNQKNTEHILKEKSSNEVSSEHATGQTEVKSVTQISDIFKHGEDQTLRTVLTVGEAGIGKSFSVQELTQHWAENKTSASTLVCIFGKGKEDTELIFPFTFSTLNEIKEKKISLVGLLNHFFEETKESVISSYAELKVLFVFDGLNMFELPLDFDNNETLTDIRQPATVDVLLTNLIKGNLLPSARVWITSRPSDKQRLCCKFVDRVTEIRVKPHITCHQKLKSHLKNQFHCVSEWIAMQAKSALLNEIYTDLYIIEGDSEQVNSQNEIRKIQGASLKPVTQETSIKYCDIFKPLPGENKEIRTVLTNGMAGIGKTIASQKYMLDWAEGVANQETYYIFPFPFRELNLRKEEDHSLEGLIHQFFPYMKASEISNYDKYQILIVLDGLNECRLDLNFKDGPIWTDVRKSTSVNVLMTNLIQGNLLSRAQIWITSRPAASNRIPSENVDRVTEVRGFNDLQKEEYFRKRFSDEDLTERVISHVKKSRSLYIMCHIPVFCWITATVLGDLLSKKQEEEMPKTLTDMLSWRDLSKEACAGLACVVLSSGSSNLTELDFSNDDLMDSGVELLSDGLKSVHCRLEILKLSGCQVTEIGCASLASALKSRASKLKQLDLSYNHPGESGVRELSAIKEDPHLSLGTLRLDHGGEHRLKPGLKKYGVDLMFQENTAGRRLVLSKGNSKTKSEENVEETPHANHPDRFNKSQVICEEGLTSRCYWEVEWRGTVSIGVTYKGVKRRGSDRKSWSLLCSNTKYTAWHVTPTDVPPPSQKIALFLDWEGGTLDYYSVSSGKLTLIHTFHAKFNEPVYPSFWFQTGSVFLCPIK